MGFGFRPKCTLLTACAVCCAVLCYRPCCVQIEAVWLQDFASRIPGYPDIGPCIVVKGKQPCCGLLPAAHMTDNPHVAIPLRVMRKVGRAACNTRTQLGFIH